MYNNLLVVHWTDNGKCHNCAHNFSSVQSKWPLQITFVFEYLKGRGEKKKKGRHWPSFLQNNGAILCHIDPGHLRISEGGNEGAQLLEGRHAHPARLVCQQVHKEVGQVLAPCLQRTGTGDGHEALGACLAHSPHTIATQVVEFGQLSQIDGHKKHSEHIKTTNGNFHPGFMKNSAILQLGGPLFKTNSNLSYKCKSLHVHMTVSYTHLTLPTKLSV